MSNMTPNTHVSRKVMEARIVNFWLLCDYFEAPMSNLVNGRNSLLICDFFAG